jgi:hypothetical protein
MIVRTHAIVKTSQACAGPVQRGVLHARHDATVQEVRAN